MLVASIVRIDDFWSVHRRSLFTIRDVTGPQVPLSRLMDRVMLGIPITVVVDSDWTVIAGADWARAMASIPHSEELIEGIQARHYARTTALLRQVEALTCDGDRHRVQIAQRCLYEAAVHVLAQPGGVAWNVFDGALLNFAQGFPDFVAAQGAGAVQHAGDAAALAQLIGCPPDVLQATLNAVQPGTDAVTGRTFQRALHAPFHAIKVTGALFHTQGGLDIDAQARVLREDGTPLPNVLAAGGAARGVSGQAVWGYLSGNGLLSAIAGGHIAAHTAAHMAQQLLKDSAR